MPPYIMAEFQALHPYQQTKFMELIGWSNSGTSEGSMPTAIAYEKALEWAKQVAIPEAPVEEEPS